MLKKSTFLMTVILLASVLSGCIGGGDVETTPPAGTTLPPGDIPAPEGAHRGFVVGESYTYEVSIEMHSLAGDPGQGGEAFAGELTLNILETDTYDFTIELLGSGLVDGWQQITIYEGIDVNDGELYYALYHLENQLLISGIFFFSNYSPFVGGLIDDDDVFFIGSKETVDIEGVSGTFEVIDTCEYDGAGGYLAQYSFGLGEYEYSYQVCYVGDLPLPSYVQEIFTDGEMEFSYTAEMLSNSGAP